MAYVVLLDNLVESRVVQLNKLGKVVDIGNEIIQVLLKQDKLLLSRSLFPRTTLVQAIDYFLDLAFAHSNAPSNFHSLELLLRMHLVQLGLEFPDETSLVLFGPCSVGVWIGTRSGWSRGVLEIRLEFSVVNVVSKPPLTRSNYSCLSVSL